jgi:hypothetical protein
METSRKSDELKNLKKRGVHKSGTYVKIQLFTKRVGLDLICISLNSYFHHNIAEKTRPGLEPTIYRTRGEHSNHYPTARLEWVVW